jgi:methylamine---glutamate N-methyltransferase subunit C
MVPSSREPTQGRNPLTPIPIAQWPDLSDRQPHGALTLGVDLVVVRWGDDHSVLYGRCLHRGALMADGKVVGDDLICGLHGWDYRFDTGVSSYNPAERLHRFTSWVEGDTVYVDGDEIAAWLIDNPQPYDRTAYQGAFQDVHGAPEEPHVGLIRRLAQDGLTKTGHHGPVAAMGVPRDRLPSWDDIQFVTAQLARRPLLDEAEVDTSVVIGAAATKPLRLEIPIFVSDMSFGALSEEAKVALARGAELAGTAICSGEGGMLPEEKPSRHVISTSLPRDDSAGARPGLKTSRGSISSSAREPRPAPAGTFPATRWWARSPRSGDWPKGPPPCRPATFTDLVELDDYRRLAETVREVSGGVPIGAKLSAQHIEADIDAAVFIGVDYIILDGRGGGTGSAPLLFRDNISVPTIPALARARRHLDRVSPTTTLVITGGLRTPWDFAKAMALGADAVAVSNAALQAIGCIGMRACNSNNCPVGIATQQPHLRARLPVDDAAHRLATFLDASTELMTVLARACGHDRLDQFGIDDLTTFDRDTHHLTGIAYGGVNA